MANLVKNNDCIQKFCELIGDKKQELKENIISHEHKAVLLMPVEDSESDNIMLLLVAFNKIKNCITEIMLHKSNDVVSITNSIRSKLGNGNYMKRVQEVCKEECKFFFEGYILYYSSIKGNLRIKVADFNTYSTDIISGLFNAVKNNNIVVQEVTLNGLKYIAIEKKFVDQYFGCGRRNIYRSLSVCGIIYHRYEGGKYRYSYIEKKLDDNGVIKATEYFAVTAEAYQTLIIGEDNVA